ncbi:MAG: superoxide dismutase [Sphingobacteriia bacterium]|nr:MAG: superoxide dismutase [Sphingobacteriia bacterium]
MKYNPSRRAFLKDTGTVGIATGIGLSLLPTVTNAASKLPLTGYLQQKLPYDYKALEPFIDALTMEIHYSKHAAAYAKNLSDACTAEKIDTSKISLEDLLQNISNYSPKMRNNGGGHYNHELFWQCMKGGIATMPNGELAHAITKSFGSFEAFKTQFTEAGKNRFGSGWAWLVQTSDQKLVISSTPNQDNPLMNIAEVKGKPLLGLDIWEHAYYLKYQNKRADYIANWWNIVNWNFVEERFGK